MIQSMTAFARAAHQSEAGNIVCELRSVNHRYLDLNIKLPEIFYALEQPLRERLRHVIKRGKVDCFFRYQAAPATHVEFSINETLVEKICQASEKVATQLNHASPLKTVDILHWPGVLSVKEMDLDVVQEEVFAVLDEALISLVAARQREGAQLVELCQQRLVDMQTQIQHARLRLPVVIEAQRQRLLSRFQEVHLQLDASRLEQEMVILAQKMDVTEELDRLETHITEIRRIIKSDTLAGRRLDFLMQELHREANTLGSKSIDAETTRASVELKVLIEQMREQVQNVE